MIERSSAFVSGVQGVVGRPGRQAFLTPVRGRVARELPCRMQPSCFPQTASGTSTSDFAPKRRVVVSRNVSRFRRIRVVQHANDTGI